jgi:hypothetical protein
MGVKELKTLKEQLNLNLTERLKKLIGNSNIESLISDDLETIDIIISSRIEKDIGTTIQVDNKLSYNVKSSHNILFSGSNNTILKTDKQVIVGVVANSSQVDLSTLEFLKNEIYQFCIENELLDPDSMPAKDAGVGTNK